MTVLRSEADHLVDLLGLCALKDQRAFSSIYKKTSSKVFGVLVKMLNNKSLAEEVLQEAYIQVWEKASVYNIERGQPLTWIINIARYRALDMLRKQKTRSQYEDQYGEEKFVELVQSVHGFGEHTDDTDALVHCLDGLQAEARISVVRAYCEGYTHEELSQSLKKPIGTIKSWIRRSLKKLQECIHELSTS